MDSTSLLVFLPALICGLVAAGCATLAALLPARESRGDVAAIEQGRRLAAGAVAFALLGVVWLVIGSLVLLGLALDGWWDEAGRD